MERLIHHYLRILDIDPLGHFIRLINQSHSQSLDLSNIYIRQFSVHNRTPNSIEQNVTLNSYTFDNQIQPLLHSGEVVTIYSRDYRRLKLDIAPHIFIALDVSQWLIDDHVQTEISINKIVFDFHKNCSFASNDVPLLFINQFSVSKPWVTAATPRSNRYARSIFPYCLPIGNIVNPHTWAISDRDESKLDKKPCHENNETVEHFDSYPRRLTTAPKIAQLSKKN